MVLKLKKCKTLASLLSSFLNIKPKSKSYKFLIVVCGLVTFSSHSLLAETMFEGYYQIRVGGVHSGYVIQKYEFDSKKKLFTSIYYIRTNPLAGNITESLKALSNDKFEPISYQYTSKTGETVKTIDATFKGNKMLAVISDGKLGNKVEKEFAKGTFLSTFLAYMMLSKGISKGKVYSYSGIAEEDAAVYNGKAMIQDNVKEAPVPAYKVLNDFKSTKFISIMSQKGEVLETKSPVQQIETRLVKTPVEATKGFQIDSKSLSLLFGSIPTGKTNELVKAPDSKVIATKKEAEIKNESETTGKTKKLEIKKPENNDKGE